MPKFTRNGVTINFENEPSDEDLDEAFASENSPQEKQDTFGNRFMEQSQLGQAVVDPIETIKGFGGATVQAGGDPIKLAAQGLIGQVMAGKERFGKAFNRINEGGDTFGRSLRAGQALISPFPIVGEMVQPLDEDIQGRNPLGVAGTLAGAGVDAGAAALVPKVPGALSSARSGIGQAGSAMAENASRRILRNQALGPVTFGEAARDLYTKRLPLVAATSMFGMPGIGMKIAGTLEAIKMAGRSQTLARMQQSIGRKMAPVNSELAEFLMKEEGNPALKSAIVEGVEEIPGTEAFEPHVLEPDPPNKVKTSEELWTEQNPVEEFPKSYQGGQEPWDATKGSQTHPEVSAERIELPEIKGKEGKKILGEDQNRVSRFGKSQKGADEDILDLDPKDNTEIDLDEPEIVARGNKLVDTSVKPPKKIVEVVDKTIPFADLEPGNRVKTKNGKEGTLESFDEKSVVVKWDNGSRTRIARKAVEKVEGKDIPQSGSMRAPKNPRMESRNLDGTKGPYKVPPVIGDDPRPQDMVISLKREANILYTDLQTMPKGKKSTLEMQKRFESLKEQIAKEEAKKTSPRGESIDEPLGNVDPFTTEPIRGAHGKNRPKIEPKLEEVGELLNPRSTRDKLLNPRRLGKGSRQTGTSPRILKELKKAGVTFSPEEVRTVMETGDKTVRTFGTPKKGLNVLDDGKKKIYAVYDGQGKLVAYGQADIKTNTITDRFKWTKGFEETDRKSLRKETREIATKASEQILDAMVNDGFVPPGLGKRSADAIKSWHRFKANRSETLKK